MAVTIKPEVIEDTVDYRVWLVSWTSTLAPPQLFFVYVNGELLHEAGTTLTELPFTVPAGQEVIVEVRDVAGAAQSRYFGGHAELGWHAVPAAASYRIEEKVGAVWTLRADIVEDGSGFKIFRTNKLADETTHLWRVVPVGVNGQDGTPLEFTIDTVRQPDAPAVIGTYDPGTGNLTVDAVA